MQKPSWLSAGEISRIAGLNLFRLPLTSSPHHGPGNRCESRAPIAGAKRLGFQHFILGRNAVLVGSEADPGVSLIPSRRWISPSRDNPPASAAGKLYLLQTDAYIRSSGTHVAFLARTGSADHIREVMRIRQPARSGHAAINHKYVLQI